jgi:O-antigen/teichoic acid export membrane protein
MVASLMATGSIQPMDTEMKEQPSGAAIHENRILRLAHGFAAHLFQLALGLVQQIALVPIFLLSWDNATLAAWLVIYAAGPLVLIADCGLQLYTINRFLEARALNDFETRAATLFAALKRVYFLIVIGMVLLVLLATAIVSPEMIFGFADQPDFTTAFLTMVIGTVFLLPINLAAAVYRATGYYTRIVYFSCVGLLVGQIFQIFALLLTHSLLWVAIGFVLPSILVGPYVYLIDMPRLFPYLNVKRAPISLLSAVGHIRASVGFGISNAADLVYVNAPVLIISMLVSDRVEIAQWGLSRIFAGLIRQVVLQMSLPLGAELGHDFAIKKLSQLRSAYAQGSLLLMITASVLTASVLAFGRDFFALWTHGSVPYDSKLVALLVFGAAGVAPGILAQTFANYSNRPRLLMVAKTSQVIVVIVLSILMIPSFGVLGAAVALVTGDILVQVGILAMTITKRVLVRPLAHIAFILLVGASVIGIGWLLGVLILSSVPAPSLGHFVIGASVWGGVMCVPLIALRNSRLRNWLAAIIPQ